MSRNVTVTVNQSEHTCEVEPRLLLVHLLRENLGLTGTNIGCDTSQCGSCTVLMDGQAVKSCTVLAVQADEANITTIEGLAQEGELHPLQESFWEKHGLQCGFCTPGMIMTAHDLLSRNPDPTCLWTLSAPGFRPTMRPSRACTRTSKASCYHFLTGMCPPRLSSMSCPTPCCKNGHKRSGGSKLIV